jgi:hypothetical protein
VDELVGDPRTAALGRPKGDASNDLGDPPPFELLPARPVHRLLSDGEAVVGEVTVSGREPRPDCGDPRRGPRREPLAQPDRESVEQGIFKDLLLSRSPGFALTPFQDRPELVPRVVLILGDQITAVRRRILCGRGSDLEVLHLSVRFARIAGHRVAVYAWGYRSPIE